MSFESSPAASMDKRSTTGLGGEQCGRDCGDVEHVFSTWGRHHSPPALMAKEESSQTFWFLFKGYRLSIESLSFKKLTKF